MNKLLILFLLATNLFLVGNADISSLSTIQCPEYGVERVDVEDGEDPFILIPLTELVLVTVSFDDIFANVVNKTTRFTLSQSIRAPPA